MAPITTGKAGRAKDGLAAAEFTVIGSIPNAVMATARSMVAAHRRLAARWAEFMRNLRPGGRSPLAVAAVVYNTLPMEVEEPAARAIATGGLRSELLYATAATAVAVGLGALADRWFGFRDLSLIFITGLLFVSVRTRMSVAVYAAVLFFLCYNFFFIHPRYTFYIAAGEGVATVGLFLVAALLCGTVANRLRTLVMLLGAANDRTQGLQTLSQRLALAHDQSTVMREAARTIHDALSADCAVMALDAQHARLGEPVSEPPGIVVDAVTRTAAEACLDPSRASAHATRLDVGWWCAPLRAGPLAVGVVCLRLRESRPALSDTQDSLLQAMSQILAEVLGRTRLSSELEAAHVAGETERLRSALLSSVSHDLRSPLSTIIGSAESLTLFGDELSRADQGILAADILGEGLRLDRYIQNLLDMTRLGQGGPASKPEWVGLDEVMSAVLPRLRKAHPSLPVQLELGDEPPLLQAHPALLEQAIFNLLDNAAKYSPPGVPVTVRVSRESEGDAWLIDVIDSGPGIAEAERRRVFDMFYSVHAGDREAGTGLGLTISQGIIALHGGSLEALAGSDGRGSVFRMRLPLLAPPADKSGAARP
jgi:two-component system sensor histidine kinase KdpD